MPKNKIIQEGAKMYKVGISCFDETFSLYYFRRKTFFEIDRAYFFLKKQYSFPKFLDK